MADTTLTTLIELEKLIAKRVQSGDESSYTKKLVSKGLPKITKKLGEEAAEVIIAALVEDNAALEGELADLLYHMLVLMQVKGISLHDVTQVLKARLGTSGLEEKANRLKS